MDGNSIASSVARLIKSRGETVILRRDPATDVSCMAAVLQFQPNELVGDIRQGDRRVVISNEEIVTASWPGPPVMKDRVVIAGKVFTITAADTRRVQDVIIGHWLVVRG